MRFMPILWATSVLLFSVHAAECADLAGKTLKGSYTWKACNSKGCYLTNRGTFHVYVGQNGHLYDYTDSQKGFENVLGVPKSIGVGQTVTWTTRGNALAIRNVTNGIISTQNFTVNGSSCTISLSGSNPAVRFIVTETGCTVIDGHVER